MPVAFEHVGEHHVTKRLELFGVPEKVGLPDRQLSDQHMTLGFARPRVLQQLEVCVAALQPQFTEAGTDPGGQVAVLVSVGREPRRFNQVVFERLIPGISHEWMHGGRGVHDRP